MDYPIGGWRKACRRTMLAYMFYACILAASLVAASASPNPTLSPAPTASPVAATVSAAAPWPGMVGPLTMNPAPIAFDFGPLGNKVTIGGVISGYAQLQNHPSVGDNAAQADLDNAQIFINKSSGRVQYFAQVGGYSLPDVGVAYVRSSTATKNTYGVFSQGFVKLAPPGNFSLEVGALPTLIGAEDTFSFENVNVERGLLWSQENAVNRGVQANYAAGPFTFSVSANDGFYSNRYSWLWGSASWAINSSNTLAVIAGGNTAHTAISTPVTPLFQNNEQIYNVIDTHTSGPWTIEGYVQYTRVPTIPSIGALHDASTYGAALYATYAFERTSKFSGLSLPIRLEYLASTGSVSNGAPNVLYGPGSAAYSVTFTPTYQYKRDFIRGELSFVGTSNTTPGSVFGPQGTDLSQSRALLEFGVLF